MIKVGIVGGGGYAAGELIRLLIHHQSVQIIWVHSVTQVGKPIYHIHKDLLGDCNLLFTDKVEYNIDVLFLCSGHGNSSSFLEAHDFINSKAKIIALSQDFRLLNPDHDFVYGLPELNRRRVQIAKHIANPGCFATAIQLALLPLAKSNLLKEEIHINGLIGATGAGQRPRFSTHFSWVDNNVSIYKPFEHQHLAEIKQGLSQNMQDTLPNLCFIPIRGNFSRGIFVTVYTKFEGTIEEAFRLYEKFYAVHPFVFLSKEIIDLKQVVNTNKCFLQIQIHEGKILITSIIDNLLKGAAGQAVQNMNLMFGLEEVMGLNLKGSAF